MTNSKLSIKRSVARDPHLCIYSLLQKVYDVVIQIDEQGDIVSHPKDPHEWDIQSVFSLFAMMEHPTIERLIQQPNTNLRPIVAIFYPKLHVKWARLHCVQEDQLRFFCIEDYTQDYNHLVRSSNIARFDLLTQTHYRHDLNTIMAELDSPEHLPISLFMMDVNGMKMTNDAFGYGQGDKLLKKCATIIKSSAINGSRLIRMNGDEFLLIAPNCSEVEKQQILDNIERLCAEDTESMIPPSLSIGVATKNRVGQEISQVIRYSEQNLYASRLIESRRFKASIISRLRKYLSKKNYESSTHITRVKGLSTLMGDALHLDQAARNQLSLAADLHDIGKVSIPEDILSKKTKLSSEEWKIVRQHPVTAYRIIYGLGDYSNVAKIVLHHHERFDGTGYPDGLKGEEIPLLSRILCLVDSYDIMIHSPYGQAQESIGDVISELRRCAGTQFDPELVDIFLKTIKK